MEGPPIFRDHLLRRHFISRPRRADESQGCSGSASAPPTKSLKNSTILHGERVQDPNRANPSFVVLYDLGNWQPLGVGEASKRKVRSKQTLVNMVQLENPKKMTLGPLVADYKSSGFPYWRMGQHIDCEAKQWKSDSVILFIIIIAFSTHSDSVDRPRMGRITPISKENSNK